MSSEKNFHQQLAFAAHELCTPLTLIRFYAEAIKESDGDERDQYAEKIMQIGHELTQSSRFLLTAWSDENQRQDAVEVELKSFLQSLVESFSPLIKEKNIKIRLEVPDALSTKVCETGLRIMVNNLLHNALKFSPNGGTICLDVASDPLTLKISDQAECIPAEEQKTIFSPLIKQTANQSQAGFGLGLYICQRITKSWNTKIWVEAGENNHGNVFCFTLPQ